MRYLILILSILALTACETIKLSKPKGETVASGTLKFHLNPPHRLAITLNGKNYEGDVSSESIEMDKNAHREMLFGAYSKHYTHRYKGTLKATDGDTLACEYLSSKEDGGVLGACEDAKGQVYEVSK